MSSRSAIDYEHLRISGATVAAGAGSTAYSRVNSPGTYVANGGPDQGGPYASSGRGNREICQADRPETCSGFLAKINIHQVFRTKWTEPACFGRKQPKPGFSVKIGRKQDFQAKINQNQVFRPTWTKTNFSGQKTTNTSSVKIGHSKIF